MFVYSPELLLPSGLSILVVVRVICTSLVGVYALSLAIEGYLEKPLNPLERILCAAAAIMLIDSGVITDIIGIGIVAAVYLRQRMYRKKMEVQA